MSLRPDNTAAVQASTLQPVDARTLRSEIVAMQTAAAAAEREITIDADGGATLTLDDLNETERSAALIGASPDAYKPIPWMNAHHYTSLLKNNNLDGRLAQQIEAYKTVSQQ
jgi:hypothetical protein